jgi:hypothetical protein
MRLNRIEVQQTRTTSLRFALRYILTTYLRCLHRIRYCLPSPPDFVLAPFVREQRAVVRWLLVQANNRWSTTRSRGLLLLSSCGSAKCRPTRSDDLDARRPRAAVWLRPVTLMLDQMHEKNCLIFQLAFWYTSYCITPMLFSSAGSKTFRPGRNSSTLRRQRRCCSSMPLSWTSGNSRT